MKETRRGVPSKLFAGTVIVLVLTTAVGFSLYLTKPTAAPKVAEATTISFTPATGQMVHGGWLVVGTTASGKYAVSVYAQGLDTTTGTRNAYIIEAAQSSGAKSVVPIGSNATASEFQVGSDGIGSYFTLLGSNPFTNYENVQIIFLPGMEMNRATVVATASLSMSSH